MSFDVSAQSYERFMGRFSEPLAAQLVDQVDPRPGERGLDVGCGPGAASAVLVQRLGEQAVLAIDPSPSFVQAARTRFPAADVRLGSAEALPWADDAVDVAVAELVVSFMADPVLGLREMARVTRPGGRVAACVWDHAVGGSGPLAVFWQAAHDLDGDAPDESLQPGTREGHLAALFGTAGLQDVVASLLTVAVPFTSFDDWWETFTLGVGPAGAHVASLDESGRAALRTQCQGLLPAGAFELSASAWCACGTA